MYKRSPRPEALRARGPVSLGELFNAFHVSMRDGQRGIDR